MLNLTLSATAGATENMHMISDYYEVNQTLAYTTPVYINLVQAANILKLRVLQEK